MLKKLMLLLFCVSFFAVGCAKSTATKVVEIAKPNIKATLLYQNKNIHGFKIAPDGKNMLVIIDDTIVVFDLVKVKPIATFHEKGLTFSPTNILWSPDSKRATIIFTGDVNRMIFLDVAQKGQRYDLYAKNLLDLAWADNKNLLYKASGDTEAIFKIRFISKEPQYLTALKPGEERDSKLLLINGYQGFIVKKDDKFIAVKGDALDKPINIADLSFRHNDGVLNRDVLLEDKNETGVLLRKYGYIKLKEKTFIMDNALVFLDPAGKIITLEGARGRLLSGGIVLQKKDGSIVMHDILDSKERALPGKWQNYNYKLQNDYWASKKAVLLKEQVSKNGKQVDSINLYQLR